MLEIIREGDHENREDGRVHAVEMLEIIREGAVERLDEDLHLEDDQARNEKNKGEGEEARHGVVRSVHVGTALESGHEEEESNNETVDQLDERANRRHENGEANEQELL